MVDQISSHGSGRYSEEMLPTLPIAIFGRNHAEINLVDELGGLHGMIAAFALHQVVSEFAQVREHEREEFRFRRRGCLPATGAEGA